MDKITNNYKDATQLWVTSTGSINFPGALTTTDNITISPSNYLNTNNISLKAGEYNLTWDVNKSVIDNFFKATKETLNKEKQRKEKMAKSFKYSRDHGYVPYITKIEVLKPGKVLRFTFSDKTIIKTVCLDADTFDFKFAFFLAYAKYFCSETHTPQGIENYAKYLMDLKVFNSLVRAGMKVYFNQKKEEEKLEKEKAEREAIRENRIKKKIAKKEKLRKARIEEMAEAIKKAKE